MDLKAGVTFLKPPRELAERSWVKEGRQRLKGMKSCLSKEEHVEEETGLIKNAK
ncbi:hypothetical protein L1S32_05015 [Methanogenium sp. S4BF]|uniref:hypothetical protein n=1 Tax=Methanogenium sp. S4BF TaxID=1789226 RepID=UPI00241807BD|nr:hypothetical protein [Methanogenium sp. S4BF]WFN35472.1 hypothetical protein L1S32_05015 [Methanogenium sp. S4BF]